MLFSYRFAFCNALFYLAVSDIDVVCDEQAQAVKNSIAASQRQAAELAKEGIATSDGNDSQDSEGIDGGPEQNVGFDQHHKSQNVVQEIVVRRTTSQKGKEKVSTSRVSEDVPIFLCQRS